MIKFGYTIVYVDDVEKCLKFFELSFGMKRKFLDDSGNYGELDTGTTTLAFATHTLGQANLPTGYIKVSDTNKPLGIEIALVTDNVEESHNIAIKFGAKSIKPAYKTSWGQTVSYLQTPSGILLELCSPIHDQS